MKKLVFGLLAIVVFGFTVNAQTKFIKMALPKAIQSPAGSSETVVKDVYVKTKSGLQERAQIRFVVPDYGEGLISMEFSENILVNGGITSDYLLTTANALQSEPGIGSNLSTCIEKCNKDFTDENGKKIRGRGACKTGCWIDAIMDAVPVLLPLIL